MKIPLSWLKEYVAVDLPPKELAHRLTMAGLETSGASVVGGSWDRVWVGRVVAVEPHPNADRLTLASVDLGGERITVVCGAPNIAAGQKVPFAKTGATLLDSRTGQLETLRAARIRGVVSEGMVCSERELGLGEDHTGIVVLPQDAPVGAPLADYLGDAVLELEPTPNRPDWLSVLGVAREVAAWAQSSVRTPDIRYPEEGPPIESLVTIAVEAPDLAPRYTASLVTGIRIEPSPPWMQERLQRAGQRPINNVVDITNYVMLEYGQPLHAFDYHLLQEKRVRVRRAQAGETLVTLDGETRRLSPEMLVIADASVPVGLAGIMGGANSEMTEATTAVLLESATFHAINTRRTAVALKLRTDASVRFERRLNPGLAPVALRRATQLLQQIAGGQVARGIIDLYPGQGEAAPLILTLARVEKVLGVPFTLDEVERVLTSLGFLCHRQDQGVLHVEIPFWRSDIALEDDLVEELARTVGYDRIPTTFLSTSSPLLQPQPMRELRERVKDILTGCGMQEVISYSLTSREMLERVEAWDGENSPLRAANPMSPQREYLRTTLRANLLATLAASQRHAQEGLRLFETGRVYLPRFPDLPEEREMVVGLFWGPRAPLSWMEQPQPVGFFDAKGTVEVLLHALGLQPRFQMVTEKDLHPAQAAEVRVQDRRIGVVGEVHPRVLERFDLLVDATALFEVDLEALLPLLPQEARRYAPVSPFPRSSRDLAILVDTELPASRVEEVARRHPLVERATIFDVYQGSDIPAGKRSLALRVHLQSSTATLTAEQVNEALEEILRSLERECGAVLRGGLIRPA